MDWKTSGLSILFAIFLFVALSSASIGVSPAVYEINYEPGLKQVFHFNFLGDGAGGLKITAEDDFAENARLSTKYIDASSGGVDVTLKLPKETNLYGLRRLHIAAEQDDPSNPGFQVKGKIRALIKIKVPYPGEYAEIIFNIKDTKAGNNAEYSLEIDNLGTNSIVANSRIDIYDSENNIIESFYLGEKSINSTKSDGYSGNLSTGKFGAGTYRAVAVVEYAGKEARQEKLFRIGELYVEITDYTKELQKNMINRFEINIESKWNDPIENLYANVEIIDTGISTKTSSIGLTGFGNGTLVGFFDTSPIENDRFKAKITLNYEGKTTEKVVDLRFKSKYNYILIIIIAAIAIFVIIILILFIWIIKLQSMLGRALNERKYGKKRGKK